MRKTSPFNSLCGVTFLRQRKKGTERKDLSFFLTTKKQGNIESKAARQQGKTSEQKTQGKKVRPNVTASVLHILTF